MVIQAVPMVHLLWRRETEGRDFDSPERKAALDKTLRAAIATIKDPSIRAHYGEDIKQLRWTLFGTQDIADTFEHQPYDEGNASETNHEHRVQ